MGRAANKTLLETKNAKYKQIGEVISEQYARSQIPDGRLYMIDKVVRMRGQHGRFGIDHSELLNYELEQTNKTRDDYMNLLVYKADAQTTDARDFSSIAPMGATVSQVLYNRLKPEDQERYSDYSQRSMINADKSQRNSQSAASQRNLNGFKGQGLCYQDWLKAKDAEKRLKRKLVGQAQNQIKEELLTVAKQEREKYESRCKAMDDWLMQKKIDEAEKIAHMRELDRREEVEKQMVNERRTNSYKEWMRLQTMKKKQTRKYKQHQEQSKEDMLARQMAKQEEMQQEMRQRREDEYYEGQGIDMEDEMEGHYAHEQN